jgi:alkyl hydroperoxide reductase subunit AhpC
MVAFEKALPDFERLNTQVLGISVDSAPTKKAWGEAINVKNVPLLADFWPHGGVAQKYGVFGDDDGLAKRAIFVVDKKGIIQWAKVYPNTEVPDIDEVLGVVKGLEG